MKFVLWALVIYLGWRWLTAQKKTAADPAATTTTTTTTTTTENEVERMVQCAQCGIHLPASEAITGPQRKVFCSHEHSSQHHSS